MKTMLVNIFIIIFGLVEFSEAESMLKLSGVTIGGNQCPEGAGRVIVESGHLTLVDTIVTDSTTIILDLPFPTRELNLRGYIACQNTTNVLDEVKVSLPTPRAKVDLGYNVIVYLDSIYLGDKSRKLMSAVDSEIKFKKFISENNRKRSNSRPR